MSAETVQEILERIDQLTYEERELLDQRLADRAEAEWRREAELAREQAKAKGLDQVAVDAAIRKLRYGA